MNEIDLLQRYKSGELVKKAKKLGLTIGIERMQARGDDGFLRDVEYPNINDLYSVDCAGYCANCGKLCFNVAPQYKDGILYYVQACADCYELLTDWGDEITIEEAAKKHNLSTAWIRRLCEQERIRHARKKGNVWLIPESWEPPELKVGRPSKAQPTQHEADGEA